MWFQMTTDPPLDPMAQTLGSCGCQARAVTRRLKGDTLLKTRICLTWLTKGMVTVKF